MTNDPRPEEPTPDYGTNQFHYEDMAGWPHTPGSEMIARARRAYYAATIQQPGDPRASDEDMALTAIFYQQVNLPPFIALTISRFEGPPGRKPHRSPSNSTSPPQPSFGTTEITIGLANLLPSAIHAQDRPNSRNGDPRPGVTPTQVLRHPDWIGLDRIYPSFQGQEAYIMGSPTTNEPKRSHGPAAQPPEQRPPQRPERPTSRITRKPRYSATS